MSNEMEAMNYLSYMVKSTRPGSSRGNKKVLNNKARIWMKGLTGYISPMEIIEFMPWERGGSDRLAAPYFREMHENKILEAKVINGYPKYRTNVKGVINLIQVLSKNKLKLVAPEIRERIEKGDTKAWRTVFNKKSTKKFIDDLLRDNKKTNFDFLSGLCVILEHLEKNE